MKKLFLLLLAACPLLAVERNIPEGSVLFFDYSLIHWKTSGTAECTHGTVEKYKCVNHNDEVLMPYIKLVAEVKKACKTISYKQSIYLTMRNELEKAHQEKLIDRIEYEKKSNEIWNKLNDNVSSFQTKIFAKHIEISRILAYKIAEIVSDIAKRNKASAVVDRNTTMMHNIYWNYQSQSGGSDTYIPLYLNPAYDITQEVIDHINVEYVDECTHSCSVHCPHES